MFDFHRIPTRQAATEGRVINGSRLQGVHYPSPFFDVAHTYLPTTIKQMFRWCRYYYLTNPLISATVNKMAEYPITDIIVDEDNKGLKEKWEKFFEDVVKLRPFLIEAGLYYMCYGNAMVSLSHPFIKWLICPHCKKKVKASSARFQFRETKFFLTCPHCSQTGDATAYDQYLRSPDKVRLILWNPEDIELNYNDLTGETRYYYTVPPSLKNQITMGKRDVVTNIPQIFIDSVKKEKAVVISPENIFHFKRPSILTGHRDRGWGIPMILSVLKDVFYLQLMKKAQEAILLERIIPLTVMFPQPGSGTSDPFCVTHDTLIETRNGLLPASEVGSGDLVKSHTGLWKVVEEAVDRKISDSESVYEFKIASLTAFPFRVSEEHPVLAVKRDKNKKWSGYDSLDEPGWVDAQDLEDGDFVCYPNKRQTWKSYAVDLAEHNPERGYTDKWIYRRLDKESAEIYEFFEENNGVPTFSTKDLPRDASPRSDFIAEKGWSIPAYDNARAAFSQGSIDRTERFIPVGRHLAFIIGLYAAEGSPKGASANVTLDENEQHVADRLDECLGVIGFGKSIRSSVRGGAFDCDLNDVFLGGLLSSLCGKGAVNKRLPRLIKEAPPVIAMSAVEALFIGDGCNFSTETRRVGLKTISPQLAMDAREILISEGFIPNVHKAKPKEGEIAKSVYYQVDLNGSQADHFSYEMGWQEEDKQPWSRCGFHRGDYLYMRVSSKRKVEYDTVRGFQVGQEKSFCVAGVATHNTTVNLQQWKDQVSKEIQRWRIDRNYIPIMPLPIGHQVIGGDGRALLMSQEIRIWSDQIVAGMGVPNEFVFGGLQWSGSNVSMRMLENQFLGYIQDLSRFIRTFLIPKASAWLGWPRVNARFKPFKMADDLQRKALYLQLNQGGKISDTTLRQDSDFNPDDEDELMSSESERRLEAVKKQQLAEAEIQGEIMLLQAKYQARAQAIQQQEMMQAQAGMSEAAPGEPGELVGSQPVLGQEAPPAQAGQPPGPGMPGGAPPPGVPPQEIIMQLAQRLMAMDPDAQRMALESLSQRSPELARAVYQALQQGTGGGGGGSASLPLPEQRPPQRGPESAII